jgi:large subunit ribosomal protein L20
MRATNAVARHKRKKRMLKRTEGFWGRRHMLLRLGIEAVKTADKYATIHRKQRKRDFRSLWIIRIGAAAKLHGLNYSKLIAGLTKAGTRIDRKQLAALAVEQPKAFAAICELAKRHAPRPAPAAAKKIDKANIVAVSTAAKKRPSR